jgi:glyceraldehyde 3-phosphate dehydrogenase
MSTRIGINGFGRMGRLFLRAAWDSRSLEVVHINEPACAPDVSAHLLEFDSLHGRFDRAISPGEHTIEIAGARVSYSREATPGAIPWAARGVELVIECSGAFRTVETLRPHLAGGVKKVLVSAPVKTGALNVVMGVNHDRYDPQAHDIVTAASCTTNCLAPVVEVIHKTLGIRHDVITTIHNVTNTQRLVDHAHQDLRRARSALTSLIPTSTGSATAIGLIYPELKGRLNGLAVRVPLLNASLTDCVFEVERATSVAEVSEQLAAAAREGPLAGILGYETRPLVSVDYRGDTRSGVVDGPSIMVVGDTMIKVLVWYDSERGYVQRMLELAELIAQSSP